MGRGANNQVRAVGGTQSLPRRGLSERTNDAFAGVMGWTRGAQRPLDDALITATREHISDAVACIDKIGGVSEARDRANQMLQNAVSELANGRDLEATKPFHIERAEWPSQAGRTPSEGSAESILSDFEEQETGAWQALLLAMVGKAPELCEFGAAPDYEVTSTNHQAAALQLAHLLLHKHEWLSERLEAESRRRAALHPHPSASPFS